MDNKTPPKTPDQDFFDELNQREEQNRQQKNNDAQVGAINKAGIKNVEATNRTTDAVNKGAQSIKAGVKIINPDLAKSGDVATAVDAIHKLNMTTFNTNQGLPQLADNLVNLTRSVQSLQKDYETKGVSSLSKQLTTLVNRLDNVSKTLNGAKVTIDTNLQKRIDGLQTAIEGIDFKPTVNVSAPDTKVITTPVDFKTVIGALGTVEKAVNANKPVNKPLDLSSITGGLSAVQDAIQALRFPVPNYVLPFKDSSGKATQITLQPDGSLPIDSTAQLSSSPLSGQAKIATTGTAVQLNGGVSQPLNNGIIISGLSTNSATIEVGTSSVTNTHDGTGNGYILSAGFAVSFAVSNTNAIWVNGTSGDVVSWAGS